MAHTIDIAARHTWDTEGPQKGPRGTNAQARHILQSEARAATQPSVQCSERDEGFKTGQLAASQCACLPQAVIISHTYACGVGSALSHDEACD